ncbi:MAG: hypothetical protein K8Q99_06255 [Acholeplasmataceae bacterium]|nr:hypothetical protein [Acholeplasmataceae bacterium]
MKKILIFIVLLSVSFICFNQSSYAMKENLPTGRNYFDFRLMLKNPGDEQTYYTIEAFKVKPNTDYTFVMSQAFLKDLYPNIENEVLAITFYPTTEVLDYPYIKDEINGLVYVEFTNTGEHIGIDSIHIPENHISPNYEMVLYEGDYSDFFGFEPYLSNDEQINHQGKLLINYDQLLSLETISSYIDATNPLDEAISLDVTSDTYSSSDKSPGLYEIIYEANYNQIKKQFFLMIEVEDLTPPVISITEPIEVPLVDKVGINTIKTYISVSDNVDDMDYHDLTVTQDTYSTATNIGTYSITVSATDTSGNLSTLTFDVDLIDTMGPTIKGTDEIYLYVGDDTLSHEDILSYYTVTDDVGVNQNNLHISLDQYLAQTEVGVYHIVISATDYASNRTDKDVYIHVIDNRGPEFNINEAYIITVTPEELKSDSDIISWLSLKLEDEGIHATHLNIDHNEYALRGSTKGQYYVYLNYEVDDQIYQTRVLMDVVDESGFEFKPIYLLSLIPVVPIAAVLIMRKKK